MPERIHWGRKVPSYHGVPRGGAARALAWRPVKPSRRHLRTLPSLPLFRARWWLQLEARKTSSLHYTTTLPDTGPVPSTTPRMCSLLWRMQHVCICIYTMCLYVCMYVCTCMCVRICTYVCMCVYMHDCMHVCIHKHVYLCIYMPAYVIMHAPTFA